MKKLWFLFGLALLLVSAATSIDAASAITGVVRNGTTGTPVGGADVLLIRLQGGMEVIASTKTDAQGKYRLENPGVHAMLVRVVYRGVNFHQPVPPGRDTADVEVFEPTANASVLQIASRLIVLQPNGPVLLIGEEYSVQNHSNPPQAYYKADGSFEFQIPEGGELAQASAWGPSGMPVVQGTIDKGSRRYAIAFAFRPGQSGVRLSYQIPYGAKQATLRILSPYAAGRVLVIAPPTMHVTGAEFKAAGKEQGWNVYAREAVPAGAALDIAVSGTAPPPSASGQDQQESQGRESGRGEGGQVLPSRLDSLKWILIGGFAALFVLGAAFLLRRPVVVPANSSAAHTNSRGSRRQNSGKSPAAEVGRDVNHRLEELKDMLFRLELRHQAGTISEEEYARERGRGEKVLRDLVKG